MLDTWNFFIKLSFPSDRIIIKLDLCVNFCKYCINSFYFSLEIYMKLEIQVYAVTFFGNMCD